MSGGLTGGWSRLVELKSLLLSTLCLLGLCSQAGAQDDLLSLGKRAHLPDLKTDLQRSKTEALPDLDLRIGLDLPAWRTVDPERNFPDQVTYHFGARAPGSMVVKYRGLQGFVMKHLQRRFRREWRKTVSEIESETFITDAELTALRRRNAEATADHYMGGRWWERDWLFSLPPEKGGIYKGHYVHTVGQKVNVVEWGAFTLNNEFRARIDRVAFSLGATESERLFREPEADVKSVRADAMLGREVFDPDELDGLDATRPRPSHRLPGVMDLWIGVEPTGRLLENLSWKFKIRPRVRVKVSMRGIRTELRLRATIEIYAGVRTKRQFAEIEANVRYQPMEGEASASLAVSLLTW